MAEANFTVGFEPTNGYTELRLHSNGVTTTLQLNEPSAIQLIRLLAATLENHIINISDNRTEN